MPEQPNIDRMRSDWDGLANAKRAVAESNRVLQDLTDGLLDPVLYFRALSAAVDPQVDAPGGDPARVLHALRASQGAFSAAEREAVAKARGNLKAPERVFWRFEPEYLRARILHVLGAERPALEAAYSNLHFLIDQAEQDDPHLPHGYEALCDLMKSQTPQPLAEHAAAVTSILMAIIKRNNLKQASRERLIATCRGIVAAYVLDDRGEARDDLVLYPKTPALAAQGFYLFNEYGTFEDTALVTALYELDVRTRSAHPRAQATTCLREIEWARRLGDIAAAARLQEQALVDLAPLRRHPKLVQEQGYLRAA